jgi:dethiobiotin synthetase
VSIVLVSGTDTGAGKTLVTATLAAGLAARQVRIGVAKPVETGCAGPEATDAATLRAAAGSDEPLEAICPYRFPEPLAPSLAAERVGATIDLAALVDHLRRRATLYDLLLIEGAGGLLVPLTRTVSFADLARKLGASVLLVVGSRLGAINHALLTLEVLAARGLHTPGYVLSPLVAPGDLAVDTNAALLAASTRVPCLGALPWIADAADLLAGLRSDDPVPARARLAALAHAHLALDALT